MKPLQLALTAVVVVVLGIAIVGIGMGDPPSKFPAPTGAALAASKQRIKDGNAMVQKGKEEFEEHGCDDCHAIAATGAKGKLGPRMDAQRDPVDEIINNILEPETQIVPGFQGDLMPRDYAKRIGVEDVTAIAAFIKAASGEQGGGPPPPAFDGGSAPPPPGAPTGGGDDDNAQPFPDEDDNNG